MLNKKNIINSFKTNSSPLTIVKSLTQQGVENVIDLSRLSGIPISQFLKLKMESKGIVKSVDQIGQSLGSNELHFYELIGSLITTGVIKKSLVVAEADFIETLINGFTSKYSKEGLKFQSELFEVNIEKSLGSEVNLDSSKLVLHPTIGGYLGGLKKSIGGSLEDLSVNQLDILFKGISKRNPTYPLLDEIVTCIKQKIDE